MESPLYPVATFALTAESHAHTRFEQQFRYYEEMLESPLFGLIRTVGHVTRDLCKIATERRPGRATFAANA